MYLLDTNHCFHLLEHHPAVVERMVTLGDVGYATNVIVQAELLYMALKSERQTDNLERVLALFQNLMVHSITSQTAEQYATLQITLINQLGPKERAKRRKITIEDLGIYLPDLWIAASAIEHQLMLVSSDSDFQRIAQVVPLRVESWIEGRL